MPGPQHTCTSGPRVWLYWQADVLILSQNVTVNPAPWGPGYCTWCDRSPRLFSSAASCPIGWGGFAVKSPFLDLFCCSSPPGHFLRMRRCSERIDNFFGRIFSDDIFKLGGQLNRYNVCVDVENGGRLVGHCCSQRREKFKTSPAVQSLRRGSLLGVDLAVESCWS